MKDNGKSLCSFWGLLDFLDQWTIWRRCYHVSHCSFVRLSSCVVTPLSVSVRVCVCVYYTLQNPVNSLIGWKTQLIFHFLYINFWFYFQIILLYFCVYWYFACMRVCGSCVCLVPTRGRKRCQILWNWNYRSLQAKMCVLEIDPMSSVRAAIAFNNCTSSVPHFFALKNNAKIWHTYKYTFK